MIYYLHGDNLFLSRQKLNLLRDQFIQSNPGGKVVVLNFKTFKPSELRSQLISLSLLGEKKLYLIEGLAKFKPEDQKLLLEILSKAKKEIIFWDEKTTANLKKLEKIFLKVVEFNFPTPRLTFKLLESIYPGNQKQFLPLFLKVKEEQPLELFFYFFKKHLHKLVVVGSKEFKAPDWQKQKLTYQKSKFLPNQLNAFYKAIIELEFSQKTGQLATDFEIPLVNLLTNL